ncbi:hypothetical protein K7A41_19810 [Sphingobacterium sp. InxBP1]|uniref:hypothetical protein n=1 Tax=Sphingobacterium sp. InxBP1 TaxID=2870328 RepID=UPI0022438F61|nr:hypothetical protein [Sphingobacterium sp. InxBP1]MCW8313483.1 hypothetical protein [Sphingobacterium sp. InxBP1]
MDDRMPAIFHLNAAKIRRENSLKFRIDYWVIQATKWEAASAFDRDFIGVASGFDAIFPMKSRCPSDENCITGRSWSEVCPKKVHTKYLYYF